jgi:hypothetical protein
MAELVAANKDALSEIKPYEVQHLDVDSREVYERGKVDINFFASVCLPTVMVSPLPDFYVAIFHVLVNRTPEQFGKILRFALGLPRAHAKTTFIKILICWLIAYDKYSFIAVICATDDLAQNLIGDISDALGSPNMEQIYGNWQRQLSVDNKEEKRAVYHGRAIILKAKGAGGALRGLNIRNQRPDLIFFDDAQTKECDESPTEREKFRRWLVASFKLIAPVTQAPNRLIIYVGNMYSDECILYQLKNNPSWVSLITGAILENGEPLWPQLHPLEELMESYFHDENLGEADVWFAEVMNDPVSRATSLLHSPLGTSPMEQHAVPDGVFLTIDPAGFRDHSDDNVIVVHYVYDGRGHVALIDAGIKDPEQLIIRALQLALHHGASLIGVEDVAYQQTLLFWLSKYIAEWKIQGIEVQPLKPRGRSKETRIRLFVAELYAGNYYLCDGPKAIFVWQAMKYKVGLTKSKDKKNKDDILDACAYGLDVRNEYWHLVRNNKALGMLEGPPTAALQETSPF